VEKQHRVNNQLNLKMSIGNNTNNQE